MAGLAQARGRLLANVNVVSTARRELLRKEPATAAMSKADVERALEARMPDFTTNTIGRFELIRELARGGMGRVFLGRDVKLGRRVAIKFLLRDDAEFVQRFLIEARVTATCTHENIVTIYEVGEHEGLPYMVLEYLEGKTLGQVFDAGLSLRQFVELMVPIARALVRAHDDGIVHRDLKPSNVIVTDRGQIKVLDFGIARLVNEAPPQIDATPAGVPLLLGTVPYMSPEQWGADTLDHQTDIWAFGILCWRALAGVHPAGTVAPAKLGRLLLDLDTPLQSIAQQVPTLPSQLVAIVDRCLEKRKSDRYQDARELLCDLEAFLLPPRTRETGEICPYQGLAAFGEQEARYFFGRAAEIRMALGQLETWPLLAVVGPSGVGKSSFIHAGIVPALRARQDNLHVHVVRPGRTPLARLAALLGELIATGDRGADLVTRLADEPGQFGATLRDAANRSHQQLLIVVDQLEELFTLCDSDETRASFLTAVLSAADDPSSPIRVVLSMRADFLDRLGGHRVFLAELTRGLVLLSAPEPSAMREALVRPAQLAGYEFEDGWIVDEMLEAATARGALPLLSFAASRLWLSRDRERHVLSVAAYNEMGGVWGAFVRHADQVLSAVPPADHKILRAIMLRLVTSEGTRAVVDREELETLSTEPGVVARIVDHLVRARLVHTHAEADGRATVEIVHESLIGEWPTLKRWLEEGHALRTFQHELQHAAKQWATHDKSTDLLWQGAVARDALANAAQHVLELSSTETEFLDAVRARLASIRRRRYGVIAAIACCLALVLVGITTALVQIRVAERKARDKATTAELALGEAKVARDALQGKLDVIEAERRRRTAAEEQRIAEEEMRRAAEKKAATARQAEELSREQLKQANVELQRRVREALDAKEKAEAARAIAKRAVASSIEAKNTAEKLLVKERAAREKLQRALREIDHREL